MPHHFFDCLIYFSAYRHKIIFTHRIFIKRKGLIQSVLQNAQYIFFARHALQKLQCPQIVKCLLKNFKPYGRYRTCFSRLDYERISRRKRTPRICHLIGIYIFKRILSVPKIVAPMQKSHNIIFVKLETYDSIAAARHRHKPIAHLDMLRAAIICP